MHEAILGKAFAKFHIQGGGGTNMRIGIHVTESYIRVTVLPPHDRVQEIN